MWLYHLKWVPHTKFDRGCVFVFVFVNNMYLIIYIGCGGLLVVLNVYITLALLI